MGRWQPDAQRRLREAAIALYSERGMDQTTVAEIAARAGVTERTFFRYFADKREVLFGGTEALLSAALEAVRSAPPEATAIETVGAAIEAAAATLPEQEHARSRRAVIAANPGLQERELLKLAGLTTAMADALRKRGTPEPTAKLGAECGLTIFRVAFSRWVDGTDGDDMAAIVDSVVADLRGLTAAAR